jgi:hypothetical protein
MNLDAMLEVGIGLVAAWLTLSVAVSQIQEWISSWLGWRAKDLEKIIANMLVDGQLVKAFYNHPYIQSMSEPGKNRGPSYIQASTFSTVMMDLIANAQPPSQPVTDWKTEMNVLPTSQAAGENIPFGTQMNNGISQIKQNYPGFGKMIDIHFPRLSTDITRTDQSIANSQTSMENWYDSVQERASGWYKRRAILVSFAIGLILAATFNIDSIQIATQLWKAPTVRQALVAQATTTASGTVPTNTLSTLLKPQDYANSLAIPIGWPTPPVNDLNEWPIKILGIILTGLAAAQGSPFWFNVLNKLVNMRGSGSGSATPAPASTAPTPAPAPAPVASTDGPVG